MNKKIINTNKVFSSNIFSQGIKTGPFLWISGQIAMDVKTGNLINDTFENEVEQCIKNIESILRESSYTLGNIIKVSIYLTDLKLYNRMNQVYLKYFSVNPPARVALGVSELAKGAKIEMEVVAFKESD